MLEWNGDPLLYPRSRGAWGMVIGRYHYLFDPKGCMESMQPVCREIVHLLLKPVCKDPAMMIAAHLRSVPETGGTDEKQG